MSADQIKVITSLQNTQIKRLVRLRQRRARESEGVILIEGAREVSRAVAKVPVKQLFLCPELFSPEAHELKLEAAETSYLSVSAFEKVSVREHPDGVLAILGQPQTEFPQLAEQAMVVVLHGLEKPGNIGAILRTADAAGASAVLVLGHGADPYSPNVIRASQGSVFNIPILCLPEAEALAWLSKEQFQQVACTPEAQQTYWQANLTGRVALLMGTEHEGLPSKWRHTGNQHLAVKVPMLGEADSLNVATATALMLYECVRQRQVL